MFAGPRIPARPSRAMLDRKGAETAQLDPVPARQSRCDLVEDRVHNILHVPLIEMRVLCRDLANQIRLDHPRRPVFAPLSPEMPQASGPPLN
jgi:hypothetical protein